MNRREAEERMLTVEAKVRFIMHTLALTRRDNSTGETDSRTLETLFAEALHHETLQHSMDGAHLAQLAQVDESSKGHTIPPDPPPVGLTVPATPGPDGDSRSPDECDGDPADGEPVQQQLPFTE